MAPNNHPESTVSGVGYVNASRRDPSRGQSTDARRLHRRIALACGTGRGPEHQNFQVASSYDKRPPVDQNETKVRT